MSSAPTRARTAVATALLALLGMLAVSPAAAAAPPADPGPSAAFVATTLAAGGDHYVYPGGTYFDGGNTIDAILALDGAHAGQDAAAAATAYLVAHLGDYIGTGGETYAGPTAKALLAVLAQGLDPHSVGGVDLLATLTGLQAPSGRFSDVSAYGDYSNTIGQSLAIVALARAGAAVTDPAVAFLLAQQCQDGGFRIDMDAATCVSDPDATGFAVQALLALPTASPAASTAATDGLDFLVGRQSPDGGMASADGGPNANTTGVAAQAFAAGGRDAALTLAQSFLASLQYGCPFPAPLRGGIAFTTAELAERKAAGSAATPTDSDLRSTPQATLGLAGGTLAAVTSSDASASAPAMVCAAPPSPTTTTTPTSTTSATGAPPSRSATADAAVLAYTGASVTLPALLGLGLVAIGAAAMLLSARFRYRGARR